MGSEMCIRDRTYSESIKKFGSDKPDLRNPLELIDVKDIFTNSEFKVFGDPAKDAKSRLVALKISSSLVRSQIDDYTKFVGNYGAKGLAYIKVNDANDLKEGLQSPILKFLSETEIESLSKKLDISTCLLYTSPSPRDLSTSRMPSSA